MFQKVFDYKPKERDYLLWTVVHPGVWLLPIMIVVLLTALAVHSFVLADGSKYNFLAATVEAPAEEAAPAAAEPEAAAEEAAPAAAEPAAEEPAAEPAAEAAAAQ